MDFFRNSTISAQKITIKPDGTIKFAGDVRVNFSQTIDFAPREGLVDSTLFEQQRPQIREDLELQLTPPKVSCDPLGYENTDSEKTELDSEYYSFQDLEESGHSHCSLQDEGKDKSSQSPRSNFMDSSSSEPPKMEDKLNTTEDHKKEDIESEEWNYLYEDFEGMEIVDFENDC